MAGPGSSNRFPSRHVEPATNYNTNYQEPHTVHSKTARLVGGLRDDAPPELVIIRTPRPEGYHEINMEKTTVANPGLPPGRLEAELGKLPQRVVHPNFDYSRIPPPSTSAFP